jgi:hypothetical protein
MPAIQLAELQSDSEDEKILVEVDNFANFTDNPNYMGLLSSGTADKVVQKI